MIKKLLAGLMASVSLTAPAVAKVDPGTPELIRTAEQYGATFVYNTSACTGRSSMSVWCIACTAGPSKVMR